AIEILLLQKKKKQNVQQTKKNDGSSKMKVKNGTKRSKDHIPKKFNINNWILFSFEEINNKISFQKIIFYLIFKKHTLHNDDNTFVYYLNTVK
ncbi:hypothetical protein RFI_33368, partial [Reticulomyxa filosa]